MCDRSSRPTAGMRRACSLKGWKDEGKWIKAATAVELTPQQRTRVLAFREEALAKLRGCATHPLCSC